MGDVKKCVWCGNRLKGRKLKYCNELCKYRFLSLKNDIGPGGRLSKAQGIRMVKAGRAQRAGKIGARFN